LSLLMVITPIKPSSLVLLKFDQYRWFWVGDPGIILHYLVIVHMPMAQSVLRHFSFLISHLVIRR
ncbi:MAG: hypothetical protein P8017_04270, partial [Deltaproteobacteria bacterium]